MKYAVIVLLSVHGDRTSEVTRECEDEEAVKRTLDEVFASGADWRAISVVHIEDFPAAMDGATPEPTT